MPVLVAVTASALVATVFQVPVTVVEVAVVVEEVVGSPTLADAFPVMTKVPCVKYQILLKDFVRPGVVADQPVSFMKICIQMI